ncbi:MAG: hypothetical protein FWD73_00280 [Polyangiaceae bacterium]|nr:hypothetical protein [Polyangiaceae bacterium]
MSEYQYYEFQAIDRTLTEQEQSTLRKYSTRASITPSRFVVDYSWGDFGGDEAEWMEKYFDAFLYLANWGSHVLMLRLPRGVLPLEMAEKYCAKNSASVRANGNHVILEFQSDTEDGGEWIDENGGTLAAILPVRAELARGDLRALYIAWLGCAQAGEFNDDDAEPPCPPGLDKLSHALSAFAEFLRIDRDLIEVAAAASPKLKALDNAGLEAWVVALPEAEKTSLLVRLVGGTDDHLRDELVRRFRQSRDKARDGQSPACAPKARSVGELLEIARSQAEERRRQEAERAARKKARHEQEEAKRRERYLTDLATRATEAWHEVSDLIATKNPTKYDEAVSLLVDLRDVCIRDGRLDEAMKRIAQLTDKHPRKSGLLHRLRKASLL